jgi:hypothetical protein
MNKILLFLLPVLFFAHQVIEAQTSRLDLQKLREPIGIDSSYTNSFKSEDGSWHISLMPVEIVRPFVFTNEHEAKKYNQLLIDVRKAYPLSLIVGSEYRLVNSELDSIYKDKSSRKKYIKWYQDYVYKKYIDSVKTLNVRQGKILLKLICRETGKSPYELIKEYRGGLNAFFWQSMAFMFGANLKSEYDPAEDAMIENIVRRIKSGEFNN